MRDPLAIRLTGVGLRYGAAAALAGVDLRIEPGECVALIGSSGAGKSSLLGLLATRQRPSAGELALGNENPWAMSARRRQRLRARIGLIQQAPPLPPRQRVVTAVGAGRLGQWSLPHALANLVYPLHASEIRAQLARLDLADRLFARCDQLSGGQLQRVAIARVLFQQPQLLLADEPVSAMDPVLAAHTLELLTGEARQRGVALVASLHAVELALSHFDRVVGIRAGRIAFDSPVAAVSAAALDALYLNEALAPPPPPAPVSVAATAARC